MSRLTKAQLKAFDEWLFEYCDCEKKIAIRKLELQSKENSDKNIGGSRSGAISKPTESIAVKWADDERIKSLESFQSAVKATLAQLDDELTRVFELRWGRGSLNTWEEIAEKIQTSTKGIYRKRQRILEIFADKMGK
ncbi:transcriptional regulator [Streptococcus cuniculi]|uniref:Transcriptional regulator n=1 Tax=Streptococcus cuniculi TaxID=1432788 RepID=A0A4Y9JCJ6_9STRE|nr:transcriptional regulator [Streptococcus cuniculi]MBF0778166.1 transcriptional regulator [Streptococcus cuniculi]TFU97908.1 transcriptional regulator [Streptococcus cuniculi]